MTWTELLKWHAEAEKLVRLEAEAAPRARGK
jgi:hypothetical protein